MSVEVDVPEEEFQPGDLLYEKDDPAEFVYFVQQGSVVGVVGKHEIELCQGEVFGDVGSVTGTYRATFRAGKKGCRLLVIPMDRLKDEIGRSPPLVRLLIGNMFGRLRIAAQLLEDLPPL